MQLAFKFLAAGLTIAVLIFLPACEQTRRKVSELSDRVGLTERDDREEMLAGARMLPPPQDVQHRASDWERSRSSTSPEAPIVLPELDTPQQPVAEKAPHPQTIERIDEIEKRIASMQQRVDDRHTRLESAMVHQNDLLEKLLERQEAQEQVISGLVQKFTEFVNRNKANVSEATETSSEQKGPGLEVNEVEHHSLPNSKITNNSTKEANLEAKAQQGGSPQPIEETESAKLSKNPVVAVVEPKQSDAAEAEVHEAEQNPRLKAMSDAQQGNPAALVGDRPVLSNSVKPERTQAIHEGVEDTKGLDKPAWLTEDALNILKDLNTPKKLFTPAANTMRRAARKSLLNIVEQMPTSPSLIPARKQLAEMALEDGDYKDALHHYERLLIERPDNIEIAEAHLSAGKLRRLQGDYHAARDHFWAFTDKLPEDRRTPWALLEVAKTHELMGENDRALAGYWDLFRRLGDEPVGKLGLEHHAMLLMRMKQYTPARKSYRLMARRSDPGTRENVLALMQTARSYLAEEKPEPAKKVLTHLLSGPVDANVGAEAAHLLGNVYLDLKEPLEAARVFVQAAETYPNDKRIFEFRQRAGEEYAAAGLHERAQGQFERILKDSGGLEREARAKVEPKALLHLAKSLRAMEKFDPAREVLRQLSEYWSDVREADGADMEHAELLIKERKFNAAIALLENIARLYQGTPLARRAIIRKTELEEMSSNPGRMEQAYRRMTEVDPSADPSFDFRRGVVLLDLGREDEALRLFRRMAGDPTVPERMSARAKFQIAVALERQGKFEDAISSYRAFVKQYTPKDTTKSPDEVSGAVPETDEELDEQLKMAKWKIEKLEWIEKLPNLVSYGREAEVLEAGKPPRP